VNGGVATTLLTKGYDHAAFGSCGYQGGYGNYPLLPGVTLHDDANYGLSFPYRGNVTGSTSSNTTVCQLVDYLGTVRSATGPFGTTTTTPDATKQYAVPSTITANGYSTSLQWDGLLNLTQSTGPNSATMNFGYDAASRPASTQGVDGDAVTYT
jgi:YD repeat-containing protein